MQCPASQTRVSRPVLVQHCTALPRHNPPLSMSKGTCTVVLRSLRCRWHSSCMSMWQGHARVAHCPAEGSFTDTCVLLVEHASSYTVALLTALSNSPQSSPVQPLSHRHHVLSHTPRREQSSSVLHPAMHPPTTTHTTQARAALVCDPLIAIVTCEV
jgi:hypothetical protein